VERQLVPKFRRSRLRPRPLTPTDVAALKARPWPRLPWWLWAAALLTTVALVVVVAGLLHGSGQASVPLGARRPPPSGDLTHTVGNYRVPALTGAAGADVRRHAGCPRLASVTLAGTADQVALLEAAAEDTCALRSTAPIERARQGLDHAGAEVAFAAFQLTGVESTTVLRPNQSPLVLVNADFQLRSPQAIAVELIHEGSHIADGRLPTAADELAARHAELDACERLFTPGQRPSPNPGCVDAGLLLAQGDANALAELRKAGYR